MDNKALSAYSQAAYQGTKDFLIVGVTKRHIEILEEIKRDRKEWVFYDEFILDVGGFKWNHPGGRYIFPLVYGQDAGKFINGCSSISDDLRPHKHSEVAKNMINFLKIGKVAYPQGVLQSLLPHENESSMSWTLTNNTMISSVTHCLEFSSLSWEVNSDPPGYEWMGKHFLVTLRIKERTVSRYYSLVIVNIAIWAEQARAAGYVCKNYDVDRTPGKLRLHVKEYTQGLMSSTICTMQPGSIINFKGPLGPGLCIQSILDRDYLIFGAGTGILPFLDIIYNI